MQFVVAGIGTEVGKTVISAILVEKLQADYWKPIQAGELDFSDTMKVKSWTSNPAAVFHQEAYALKTPMSPHGAAAIDGVSIRSEDFQLPPTNNHLIVELAGGLMVPFNNEELIIDLLEKWQIPVILVSHYYLGSINHTLLSIDALNARNIPIKGLIFNGNIVETTKDVILSYSKLPCIGEIDFSMEPSKEMVKSNVHRISL